MTTGFLDAWVTGASNAKLTLKISNFFKDKA